MKFTQTLFSEIFRAKRNGTLGLILLGFVLLSCSSHAQTNPNTVVNTLQVTGSSSAPSGQGVYIYWDFNGNNEADLINTAGGGYIFYNSVSAPLMTLNSSGNVGIGTTSPSEKLDVNGDVNIASASYFRIAGIPVVSAQPAQSNYYFGSAGNTSGTGQYNNAIGTQALLNITSGSFNNAIGSNALRNNTSGILNFASGYNSLSNNQTGFQNLAYGYSALYSNVTGDNNLAFGTYALSSNVAGGNVSMGTYSLYQNTTGSENTAIGDAAGFGYGVALQTVASSTFIGAGATAGADGITNSTAIGSDAIVTASNQIVIGNTSVTQTLLRGSVGIGTATPSVPLEVNGSVKLDSGGIIFPDGSQLTTATGIGTSSANLSNLNVQGNGTGLVVSAANLDPADGYPLAPLANSGKLLLGWNRSGGNGEQDFIANRGPGGGGGFSFYDYNNAGVLNPLLAMTGAGKVGIGTSNPGSTLEVNGNIKLTQGSSASITFPDNTVQATAWNGTTFGGDYAESVDVAGERREYEPGDIIIIDAQNPGQFNKSSSSYSKMVAGVYSTKPGLLGRRTTFGRPDKDAEVPMAMMGIVPTKVNTENGPIEPGDLLVSSSTPGYAMKGTDRDRLIGAVIGKALAPLNSDKGVIEVLLALQ